jgi:hypothetical protein
MRSGTAGSARFGLEALAEKNYNHWLRCNAIRCKGRCGDIRPRYTFKAQAPCHPQVLLDSGWSQTLAHRVLLSSYCAVTVI